MTLYERKTQLLAWLLAAVAGYVDGSGFMVIGGYFVSFMSGNSTRTAVEFVHEPSSVGIGGGLICSFLLGVITGALVGHAAGERRPPVVLAYTALLLAVAAASSHSGPPLLTTVVMAGAMGALNNVFERKGEVSIALTYVTGSLVKLGQQIATACLGGPPFGWVSYLGLWFSLVTGVAIAAATFPTVGLTGLWGTSALLVGLAALTWFTDTVRGVERHLT